MKKIFIDANIVVDYLDSSAKDHHVAVSCLRIIRKHFGKPVVSPFTFIIVNFLFGKLIKNKLWHKKQMQDTFSAFEISPVQPSFIYSAFSTHFMDMEDALQHECALHVKASVIITKDLNDYFDSKIPVVHPTDFVNRYKRL